MKKKTLGEHILYWGDCLEVMQSFEKESIDLIFTSPPYAEQRKNQYGGISEINYPKWTVIWMKEVKRILKDKGSVGIVIRKGVISRYVLNTRMALWEDGWVEPEELIWIKPSSPPLGSTKRPRRAWEHILWFSKDGNVYCDPKASGKISNGIGFKSNKFEHGGSSHIHGGQNDPKMGISRCRDYVEVGTGKIERGINHPAMFPMDLPEYMIKLCCPINGVILDPFMGSGTTMIASQNLKRKCIGIEKDLKYFKMAYKRLEKALINTPKILDKSE